MPEPSRISNVGNALNSRVGNGTNGNDRDDSVVAAQIAASESRLAEVLRQWESPMAGKKIPREPPSRSSGGGSHSGFNF